MRKNIFKEIEKNVMRENMDEKTRQKLLGNLLRIKNQRINLMITGATGVGKSSTINALFGKEVAKVGTSADPETTEIDKYELDNLVIWDTPGLGDGKEADNKHSKRIIDKLYEKDENDNLLIDLVLVILDGSSRDLGTSYELINNVIISNLGGNKENRILVAINQADVAMKGKYWNTEENRPEKKLQEFLENKLISVKRRIKEATGIDTEPIYYSAGEKEEGYIQQKTYNLSKLLYYILQRTPEEKRLVYAQNMNKEEIMWKDNDDLQDYRAEVLEKFVESVTKGMAIGGTIGQAIGSL
ncbi:GTPase family protein [Leptotrichia sp. HSP-536]|uniref:GTPase family protein n=1 Tax=Leptotrichia alba TaxID=3239304 RepID=A0AB39V1X9_9FUSO